MTDTTPSPTANLEPPSSLDRRGKMFEPLSPEESEAKADLRAKSDKIIIPVPDDAPPMNYQRRVHGQPSFTYEYTDALGRPGDRSARRPPESAINAEAAR